jgi:hypothetical protein
MMQIKWAVTHSIKQPAGDSSLVPVGLAKAGAHGTVSETPRHLIHSLSLAVAQTRLLLLQTPSHTQGTHMSPD